MPLEPPTTPDPDFPSLAGVHHVVRLVTPSGPMYALVEGDRCRLLDAAPWLGGRATDRAVPRAGARLLVPVEPSKIVCIGVNYADHAKESVSMVALPEEPVLFMKPQSALLAHGDAITLPEGLGRIDHEAEMALVIGRPTYRVSAAQARAAIAGVTAVNDVSARVLQKKDGQFTRAKGFDTFCPLGPAVALGLDPDDLSVRARVNDELRQDSRTSLLHKGAVELVVFISNVMTLLPGDVISTGTPAGVAPLAPGDVVAIEIEGLPALVNPVVERGPL
jgi:2-keto-4-pentenoate hydratase/2-oxohepta-3-ene-1,7-dioic acid hydratase in catechol pathway